MRRDLLRHDGGGRELVDHAEQPRWRETHAAAASAAGGERLDLERRESLQRGVLGHQAVEGREQMGRGEAHAAASLGTRFQRRRLELRKFLLQQVLLLGLGHELRLFGRGSEELDLLCVLLHTLRYCRIVGQDVGVSLALGSQEPRRRQPDASATRSAGSKRGGFKWGEAFRRRVLGHQPVARAEQRGRREADASTRRGEGRCLEHVQGEQVQLLRKGRLRRDGRQRLLLLQQRRAEHLDLLAREVFLRHEALGHREPGRRESHTAAARRSLRKHRRLNRAQVEGGVLGDESVLRRKQLRGRQAHASTAARAELEQPFLHDGQVEHVESLTRLLDSEGHQRGLFRHRRSAEDLHLLLHHVVTAAAQARAEQTRRRHAHAAASGWTWQKWRLCLERQALQGGVVCSEPVGRREELGRRGARPAAGGEAGLQGRGLDESEVE